MRLDEIVQSRRLRGHGNPRNYVSCWTERELLHHDPIDCLVVVLRTRGCSWARRSGCSMCGYVRESSDLVTPDDIVYQFEKAFENYRGQEMIKIFTSGSFLDDDEVPPEVRDRVYRIAGESFRRVLVESRPEFVTSEKIAKGLASCEEFEIAIGLESANNLILRLSVNKGFTLANFVKAAELIKKSRAFLKTYLLLKPPFLTEEESIKDAVQSAKLVSRLSDTISFNPVNIQKGTLVEYLWKRGEYRPPWLWSLLRVMEMTRDLGIRIMSTPSAGGTARGVHNCGECDSSILQAVNDFSLGLRTDFEEFDCECKREWEDLLETQGYMQTCVDVRKFFK